MIRITKQADYAIILLGNFSTAPAGGTSTARDLAAQTRLPVPMVGKILKALVRNGLLVSHRGVKGGYQLARPPEQISVAEIIRATDGPIGLTECNTPANSCEYDLGCPAKTNWQKINTVVMAALRNVTLADMVRSPFPSPHAFPGGEEPRAAALVPGNLEPVGPRLTREKS